jgi:LacI family transcriptional regulator
MVAARIIRINVCAPGVLHPLTAMASPPHITIKRMAEELNLSATTVSRSLNGLARQYRVSPKTEAAVRRLAQELDYSPNMLARGLRLKRTLAIGLVVPEISDPFFANIVRNVVTASRQRGYHVLLCDSADDTTAEMAAIRDLTSRKVDGLVLCPVGQSAEHLKEFENGDLPVVVVDRYFPELRLPYVAIDNFGGAAGMVRYLIERGHRRIAGIQGRRGNSTNEQRLRGYRAALEEHGIPWNPAMVPGNRFDEQTGYVETKNLLNAAPDLTAIFAFNALIMLGALRALQEVGRRVPDDVSLVCFDDQPCLPLLRPPITVVDESASELAQAAVKLLFDWIRAPEHIPQDGILLPTRFILRESVRTLSR